MLQTKYYTHYGECVNSYKLQRRKRLDTKEEHLGKECIVCKVILCARPPCAKPYSYHVQNGPSV